MSLSKLSAEVDFTTPGGAPLRHGQILSTCVKAEAGAGVALKDCPMQRGTLSLLGEGDDQIGGAGCSAASPYRAAL